MTLAIGNIVSLRVTGNPAVVPPGNQGQQIMPSILQAQPPHFGNVVTLVQPGDPTFSTSVTVLWDNDFPGTFSTTGASAEEALGNTCLDRITDGDASEVERLLGGTPASPRSSPRWVRHKAPFGDDTLDPSAGTSRSFDGTVVAVYRRTPVEEADPTTGDTFCCIRTEGGLYFEDVSSQFVVDESR